LCFEENITKIMTDNYSTQLKDGSITYKVLNFQDPANTALAMKFKVVTSSLCIDRIVKGKHNRINVQDIWYWDCRANPEYFDKMIKEVIEMALN
jgi:hypothetical protein